MKNFPPLYREQVAIWEADNVLTASVIHRMWRFRNEVVKIRAQYDNASVGWEDVCVRVPVKNGDGSYDSGNLSCYESSILEMLNIGSESGFENLTDADVIEALHSTNVSHTYGTPTDFSLYLGAVTRDQDGRIVAAGSAMHTWLTIIDKEAISEGVFEVDVATGEKVDLAGMAWEKALVSSAQRWLREEDDLAHGLRVNLRAGHTLGYVLHSSLTRDAVWIGVGWSVLLVYVLLTMGRPMTGEQRLVPACVGLLAIGMAVLSSYGACSLIGVPFGTLNNVLPVLLVALGVDDMYVIVTAWDACGGSMGSVEMRAQRAMRRAGMAITVTSVTDVLAFLVGTTTALPGLRWFCIYAAVGISMVFLLQGTLFVAAMVVNERWTRRHGPPTPTEMGKKTVASVLRAPFKRLLAKLDVRRGMTRWGRCLLRPASKGVVCALTAILFGFAIFSTTLLGREFDTLWLVPKGSNLYGWFRTVKEQFPQIHERGVVLFRGAQFPEDLPELRRLVQTLRALPEVHDVDAWFEGLDLEEIFERHSWLRRLSPRRQCQLLLDNIGIDKRRHFRVDIDLDVEIGEGEANRAASHPCSTFQIEFQYLPPPTFELKQASMQRIRQLVRDIHVGGYRAAWAHVHAQWETDRVILGDLLRSLCVVLAAVGVISLILLASIRAAIFVLLCVVGTLVSVASVARLWGLSVNTVTGIAFVLAVGICVDYAAHIAHDFLCTEGTRAERVLTALHRMGAAVFHGGASTFITFLLLAPSDNYISASYFKILTSVSFFGLFHALVFLPVILSLLGPEPHPLGNSAAKDDFEQTPSNALSVYAIELPPPFSPPPYLLTQGCPPLYRKSSSLPSLAVFISDGDSSSRKTRSTSDYSSTSSSEGSVRHSTCCTKL